MWLKMFIANTGHIGRTLQEYMEILNELDIKNIETSVTAGFFEKTPAIGYTTDRIFNMWRQGFQWEYADPATGLPSEEYRELLESHGIKICAFYYGNQPLISDPDKLRFDIKKVKGLCKLANNWGVRAIRIHGGDSRSGVALSAVPHAQESGGVWDMGIEEVIDLIVAQFKEFAKSAEEYGVDLAMENHYQILQDADRCIRIFKEVGSERLGLNNDTGNWAYGGRSTKYMVEAFKKLAPYTKSTHLKDVKNVGSPFKINGPMARIGWGEGTVLGQGDVPIKACIQELKKVGYKGQLGIHGGSDDPRVSKYEFLKKSVEYVKSCV